MLISLIRLIITRRLLVCVTILLGVLHPIARSAAQADQGSTFDVRNQINASGSFGIGPWGASASISNTIGYVSTQRSQTTEEMNTDLDLSSSVELIFRSDQVPEDLE